jgi:pimeloyl-ACP methyl ester carboxylesterase/DNA-binding CsgD family transcriptional regulator
MAVGPDRFYDLVRALETRFELATESQNDASSVDALAAPLFAALEPHFENALSLMHTAAKRRDRPTHAVKAMEDDVRAHMLVTASGKVAYANAAALAHFDIEIGSVLGRAQFEPGQFTIFTNALNDLEQSLDHQLIDTLGIMNSDGCRVTRVGIRKVNGENQEALAQISALSTSWQPDLAAQFKNAMQITPVELEIVRAIVTGMSLSDLAEERGRAVGTVRLQAKKLLSKLQLRSQTELACLYASFAELHTKEEHQADTEADAQNATHLMTCDGGRKLAYEVAGPAGGRPVLFFPALLGGAALTVHMRQRLFHANVRLITIWRPGFGQSEFDGPPTFDAFARHAADIKTLLTSLNIQSCPVIGHITSVMFAYALAKYAPECVDKIISVNGTVPSYSGAHVAHLDKSERLRFMLLRRLPKIGRMIVHSLLSKVDAGFDEEFLKSFLSNEYDYKTIHTPEIRDTFRDAFKKTIAQGYDSFVHELTLGALDWEPLVDATTCPVDMLIGAKNPVYTPDFMRLYAQDRPALNVVPVPETAHLLFYQDFDRILKATQVTTDAAP